MTDFRTHLILARASNLPTVWGNVLCAWIIVGGYSTVQLASYLVGATLLYTGGMYLNDYCDRAFDAEHRNDRPIPNGKISAASVRNIAIALLVLGFAGFAWTGLLPAAYAAGLVACILIYDKIHKANAAAPVFMAACRSLIFLTVASAFANGVDQNIIAASIAVFVYVLGVTYLARSESTTNAIDYPALAMIAAPVLASFYYNRERFDSLRAASLALFALWIVLAFFRARVGGKLIVGKTIGPLLAALPLLDLTLLATFDLATQPHLILFAVLFAVTTATQRLIPAS